MLADKKDRIATAVNFLEYMQKGMERGTIRVLPGEAICEAVPECIGNIQRILQETVIPELISLLRSADGEVQTDPHPDLM